MLPDNVASSIEYVSSDWVAVEVSAVAGISSDWVAVEVSAVLVVLPECTWVERLQLARP